LEEWRELLFQRGSWRAIMLSFTVSDVIWYYLASQLGRFWLESLYHWVVGLAAPGNSGDC